MKSPFLRILQSNYDFKGLYRVFFHGRLAHFTFGECSVSVFLVLLDSNFNQQKEHVLTPLLVYCRLKFPSFVFQTYLAPETAEFHQTPFVKLGCNRLGSFIF